MSIVRLRKVFRRRIQLHVGRRRLTLGSPMEIIFWAIVAIFVVGAYYTFGGPSGRRSTEAQEQAKRKVTKNIATVAGHVISRAEFERVYLSRIADVPSAELVTDDRQIKLSILDGMIERLLKLDAAKREGVTVERGDVARKADELVQEEMDRRFPTRKALAKYLKSKNKTVEQLKAEIRDKLMENQEALRDQVIFKKLEDLVKSRVQVTDKDLEDNYARIKARHILIMPTQLQRKDEEAKKQAEAEEGSNAESKPEAPSSTSSESKDYKALAKKQAEELLARIKKGEDFAALAKQYSHDTTSAEKGGLLQSRMPSEPGKPDSERSEYFGRGEMVPEFDKAAFALKPNEVSGVVETTYGFHIIQVLDRKVELPKDFAQRKEDYRKTLLEQRKTEAWNDYVDNLKKSAETLIEDPELAAYRALDEGKKADAIALLKKAVEADPQNVGAQYQLALALRDSGDKAQAMQLFTKLAENERAAACPIVHLELAKLYLGDKQKRQEAIEALKSASQWAATYDFRSYMVHQEVKSKFDELGEKKLSEDETKWMDEFQKQQQQMGSTLPIQVNPTGGG